MLKILCPTDFSSNSEFSAEYAIEVSNKLRAKLIFISSFKAPRDQLTLRSLEDVFKETAEEDLQQFVNKMQPLINTGITPDSVVVEGDTSLSILSFATDNNIDLIIMGTKGSSSLMNMLLGSVTRKFIENSKIPVLAIPESFKYELHSNKILLALDSKGIDNEHSISILRQFNMLPDISIDVFHVILPFEQIKLNNHTGKLNDIIDKVIEVDGLDPVIEIKKYVDDNDIGILVMVGRKHTFLERAFVESNTISELFASNIPILYMPDMNNNDV